VLSLFCNAMISLRSYGWQVSSHAIILWPRVQAQGNRKSLRLPGCASTIKIPSENRRVRWVIGIDPDTSGACALIPRSPRAAGRDVSSADNATVFDLPVKSIRVGKRDIRRADPDELCALLREEVYARIGAPDRNTLDWNTRTGIVAFVEKAAPNAHNGKQGWFSTGYHYGMWLGILTAMGIPMQPVPSSTWKSDLCLVGPDKTKDDSRALASTLFDSMSGQLKRKKDHGRAEALLIAHWGRSHIAGQFPAPRTDVGSDGLFEFSEEVEAVRSSLAAAKARRGEGSTRERTWADVQSSMAHGWPADAGAAPTKTALSTFVRRKSRLSYPRDGPWLDAVATWAQADAEGPSMCH